MEGVTQAELTPDIEASPEEDIRIEISRRNFVRAVMLAEKFGSPKEVIRHLQALALRQMACEYRNAAALRNLAQEWRFPRAELEGLLMEAVAEHEREAGTKRSLQCYDAKTGKYLTLRQWVEQFLNMKK